MQWEHPSSCDPPWYMWYQLLFLPSLPSIYLMGINKPALLSPCRGLSISSAHSPLQDPAASDGSCTIGLVSILMHHCHRWGWHQKPGLRHRQMLILSGMELVRTGALEGILQSMWPLPTKRSTPAPADSFWVSCSCQKGLSLAMTSSVHKVLEGQTNCWLCMGGTQPPSTSLGPLQGQWKRCLTSTSHTSHSRRPSISARNPNISTSGVRVYGAL